MQNLKDEYDENCLWNRLLEGDSCSLDKIMHIYYKPLAKFGLKFSADKEFIKDSIQNLFLYIWLHRQNLNPNIDLKPYLFASLRRMMNRNSKSSIFQEIDGSIQELNFNVDFTVETKWIENETAALNANKIKCLLDDLPCRQKEVIYLKYFQNMDRNQISIVMNISPQTVSNLLQLALKHLKSTVKSEFFLFCLIKFACLFAIL